MKTLACRKVMRNGIRFEGGLYYHPNLLPYTGTNVLVRPIKNRLRVFSYDEALICTAKTAIFSEETTARKQKHSS